MRWLWLACSLGCGGFERNEMLPRPRLIAPLSMTSVSSATPVFHFALPQTLIHPVIDLCRDRACNGPILHGQVQESDNTAIPERALDAGIWYWRIRADSAMGSSVSATWELRRPPLFGMSTAVCGTALDVNGDGFDELAVGAPDVQDPGGIGNTDGRVFVYAGGPGGPDPTRVTQLDAPDPHGRFGFSLTAVDFNGDGYSDLAVGAPQVSTGGAARGAVYVYYGGAGGLSVHPDVMLTVGTGGDFGWAVDYAGDFNGDGFGDLVIGAPTTQISGLISGSAYVFSGAEQDFGTMFPLQPATANLLQLGVSVTGGGDVDGDGLGDVVLGAPGASPGGQAWLVPGGPRSSDLKPLDPGVPVGAQFGYSAILLGDSDGDGLCDLAVSALKDGPGRIHLYRGVMGGAPVHMGTIDSPDAPGGNFGTSLAAGDVDGDGVAELAVAEPCARTPACDGRVYLYAGSAPTAFDGPPGSQYGTGLVLDDADGDGKADLAVGGGEADNVLGRVEWFKSAAAPAARTLHGSDPLGRFGYVIR